MYISFLIGLLLLVSLVIIDKKYFNASLKLQNKYKHLNIGHIFISAGILRKIIHFFILVYVLSIITLTSGLIESILLKDVFIFARVGAFIVLFGVLLELKIFDFANILDSFNKTFVDEIKLVPTEDKVINNGVNDIVDNKDEINISGLRELKVFAHLLIIIGTLIWAYGDKLIEHFLK